MNQKLSPELQAEYDATKHSIINIVAMLDNGSHSSSQLQAADEALSKLFHANQQTIADLNAKCERLRELLKVAECPRGHCIKPSIKEAAQRADVAYQKFIEALKAMYIEVTAFEEAQKETEETK